MKLLYYLTFIFLVLSCGKKENDTHEDIPSIDLDTADNLQQGPFNILGDKENDPYRENNFEDDSTLNPSQLIKAYSNYKIDSITEGNIYIIQPKKIYDYARSFTRIIHFNEHHQQDNHLTVNDYKFGSNLIVDSNLYFFFYDPIYGARYNKKLQNCKLVLTDLELSIINSCDIKYHWSSIDGIVANDDQIVANMRMNYGCTICYFQDLEYTISFNHDLEFQGVEIIQNADSDTITEQDILEDLEIIYSKK